MHARFLQRAALQCEHPFPDFLQVHRLAYLRTLAGEVEQRLDHTPRAHRLHVDDVGAFLEIRSLGVHGEHFREGGDRRERVVELVRHARDQGPELRQPVGLHQLPLQQYLPRHVHRQEQQFGRALGVLGVYVLDHRLHLAGRLATEVDGDVEVLALAQRVAQRPPECRA